MRGAALVGARKVVCMCGNTSGSPLAGQPVLETGVVNSKQSTVNLLCHPFFVFVVAYNNRAYLSIIYTMYI